MDWFKTKKVSSSANVPDHLHGLIRTMEDDLEGGGPTSVQPLSEPLVSFRPEATLGTPFFAAPGVVSAPEPKSSKAEESPFLQPPPLAEPVLDDAPTFDPPLVVPKAPAQLPVVPSVSPGSPVTFRTSHQSAAPSVHESLMSLRRLTQSFTPLLQDRKLRLVALMALSLFVFVTIAGGYLWWRSYMGNDPTEPEVRVESPTVAGDQSKKEPPSQTKYMAEQPNILSFDTETVTAEAIKATLLQAAQTIKQDNLSGAIEFLIRDQKLNPLAFSRFAYLAKISLPTELLGTLDEPFSLYIYQDNGRPRLVLLAYVKDEPAFAAILLRNEKRLAQAIEPLFLDVTTAPKNNVVFRESRHLGRPVRYANIDATLGLSVDYAVRGRQWIVGTSKESLRAVLDKTGL